MIKLSKPIKDLIELFRLNPQKISKKLDNTINGIREAKKDDFEYTITTGNYNYINKTLEKIFIEDVIGTTSQRNNEFLLNYVSEIYNDKYEYGKRSLDCLKRSIIDNIENINNSACAKPISIIKIKDKYYVHDDGNHRAFYLLLMYYIECELYKDKIDLLKEIKKRYNIKMLVSKISEYNVINQICYCLIKSKNEQIRMEFVNQKDKVGVLHIENQKFEIHNEEEFIFYFSKYFNSLDRNSEQFQILAYMLFKVGYFDNNRVKEIHDLYDDNLSFVKTKTR